MKQFIGVNIGGYVFNKTAKTVTITDILYPLQLERLLAIVNVNANKIIYQPNKVGYGATLNGYTFILDFDTSSMSDSDPLQIIMELPDIDNEGDNEVVENAIAAITVPLQQINATNQLVIEPRQPTAANLNMTAVIASGTVTTVSTVTTVTGVTTVSALTNMVNMGGFAAGLMINFQSDMAQNMIASNYSFT